MANPALKKREEVITDLKDAGFDARQSRGIVQAVVDTTASLGLATRADLARAVAALNGKLNAFSKRMDDIKEGLNKRIDDIRADMSDLKKEMSALKASVDRLNRAIFWGLVIGLSILGLLLR